MKARLVKDQNGTVSLLCRNGSISLASMTVLSNLLLNFKEAKNFSGSDGNWKEKWGDMSLFPGETLAYVSDDSTLVVLNSDVFESIVEQTYRVKSLISITEYAKKHNKSREIIKVLCRDNRIIGAQKIGNAWMIPADAPYPIPPHRRRDGVGRKVQNK